jgi:hypothetical protein
MANYQDFLSTQPPMFHKADEPLDADAWLHCLPCVQMRTKRCLPLNNSAVLPASGGIIIIPCSLPVMLSLGMSFGLLSERITFRRDSLSESSINF